MIRVITKRIINCSQLENTKIQLNALYKKAHTNNLDELFYEVKKNIDEDSIVLVKGSNSLGLKGFINI